MMLNRTVSLNLNGSVRSMATLKEISLRLKSVSNIAKITKSMKMIASTKMTKAQRLMDNARNYGEASAGFLKHVNVAESSKPVIVCVSSDRGLCGGIHSSVSKGAKKYLKTKSDAQLATIGLKVRQQIVISL
ncbi:atp3 gamma subunit of the F1 sector of mitochondrial F1F0 ATP synthase [Clydaea vesicula]|uniref:Atp3 gamma subunit of the F1 sector of mitochondrial F1F0 ATP synthase n=1 Tax=Clydaea vesicula TaxID=447962 RepID=A0AAD5XXP3_9FUNG|nr:atp3 gamma subunit of the F1 sector of mitochondrial F1F0 ATP synthase [Clydaea vesicula]